MKYLDKGWEGRAAGGGNAATRAQVLADQLEQLIVQQSLVSGDRLGTKAEIRASSGLASATVNEAIRLLVERERVTVRPGAGGGVFVADQPTTVGLGRMLLKVRGRSGQTVEHATKVRNALDPLVMEDVAIHRSQKDLEKLRRLLEEMERARDGGSFLDANWRFHSAMAQSCDNRILGAIYMGLMETIRRDSENVVKSEPVERSERLQIHEDIVEAIEAKSLLRVRRAAKRHEIVALPAAVLSDDGSRDWNAV